MILEDVNLSRVLKSTVIWIISSPCHQTVGIILPFRLSQIVCRCFSFPVLSWHGYQCKQPGLQKEDLSDISAAASYPCIFLLIPELPLSKHNINLNPEQRHDFTAYEMAVVLLRKLHCAIKYGFISESIKNQQIIKTPECAGRHVGGPACGKTAAKQDVLRHLTWPLTLVFGHLNPISKL